MTCRGSQHSPKVTGRPPSGPSHYPRLQRMEKGPPPFGSVQSGRPLVGIRTVTNAVRRFVRRSGTCLQQAERGVRSGPKRSPASPGRNLALWFSQGSSELLQSSEPLKPERLEDSTSQRFWYSVACPSSQPRVVGVILTPTGGRWKRFPARRPEMPPVLHISNTLSNHRPPSVKWFPRSMRRPAPIELYGPDAATAAAWLALEANFDGRGADYSVWCTVFLELAKVTFTQIR